jgi:hypothetical protein
MRKTTMVLTAGLLGVMLAGSGCNKVKDAVAPMTGVWLCTAIGGNAFGTETPQIENKYLKLFSISYAGALSEGFFYRVGTGDIQADVTGIVSDIKNKEYKDVWNTFLANGTMHYTSNTITQTSTKDGVTIKQTFEYRIKGDNLILIEQSEPIEGQASKLLDVMKSLGINISTTVGIEYTYTKTTLENLKSMF